MLSHGDAWILDQQTALDCISKEPDFKKCAVRVERV